MFCSAALRFLTFSCLILSLVFAAAGRADDQTAQPKPATSSEPARSEVDPGQEDLDESVVKRIDAETPEELDAVADLLQSAIEKGLSEENESFANKMLGSVFLQRAEKVIDSIRRTQGRQQTQLRLRDEALRLLERATKHDPTLVEAYLITARLNLASGGDKAAVVEATTKAIELLDDDPLERSKVYVLRAVCQEGLEEKLADLDAAIDSDAENKEALQTRGLFRLQAGNVDGAVKDLESLLTLDPTNELVTQSAVQQLMEMNRAKDAIKLLSKAIKASPSEGVYRMRGILYRFDGQEDKALEDFNKALAMQPKDPMSLLQRSEISIIRRDVQAAKRDLRSAIQIAPQIEEADQAIFVGCLIAIEEGRMADAINDMKKLVDRDPGNSTRLQQLANLYLQDNRPRKAIETLTKILDRDPKNTGILRTRADSYLSVGDHAAAVADYEKALRVIGDDGDRSDPDGDGGEQLSGILNNLAWVLATSTNDEVRDGERAVKYATRAVELTQEKLPHVLSTLAAAHAEDGDMEKAVQWSTKAVELGTEQDHDQLEQLQEELDNYKEGKPWREKQETEENEVPILSPEDLIDT